jgi:hypothetical protein
MEQAMAWTRKLFEFLTEEFLHALPAIVFFAIGFNLIVLSMNLVLSEYLLHFGNFMVATTLALLVGKAVLVADKMPFLRRFESAPLIQPILFKTCIYTVFVFIARLIEAYIHYMIDTGRMIGFFPFIYERFSWHRFAFVQIWILVLFLLFTTGLELNRLFGYGMLTKLLFMHRSSEFKLSRRQRIRTLMDLSRVTERYSLDELREPHTEAHRKLIGLVTTLAEDARARPSSHRGLEINRLDEPHRS